MSQREMSEQKTQFSIGQLIDSSAKQDAIHIAVAPVRAAEKLNPGLGISFTNDNQVDVSKSNTPIGIVDPFLIKPVNKGEMFWMFLLPNTITSLRHQWTHPEFEESKREEVMKVLDKLTGVAEAERWLENHALELGLTKERLFEYAKEWIYYGEYIIEHGKGTFEQKLFWKNYEIAKNIKINSNKKVNFFSCAC